MIGDCLADYSMTASTEEIGHQRRKDYNMAQQTQIWSANKKSSKSANTLAAELHSIAPKIPFLPQNCQPLVVF